MNAQNYASARIDLSDPLSPARLAVARCLRYAYQRGCEYENQVMKSERTIHFEARHQEATLFEEHYESASILATVDVSPANILLHAPSHRDVLHGTNPPQTE